MPKIDTNFFEKYQNQRVAVAVSGGVDSMALLHMVADAKMNAVALTVDHGLRPSSGAEAKMVASFAASMGVPHETLIWDGKKPKNGIEAAARNARYALLTEYCRVNKIDVLVIAHQADDQIETFLMNLARGSGVYGLAAMRSETVRDGIILARPLLDIPRDMLKEYCDKNNIPYVHDEMNDDENLLRIKMRKNRHVLRDKLDISDDRILLAIKSLGRVRDMLENTVDNLIRVISFENNRAVFGASFLFDMDAEIRLKFISRLLQIIGKTVYPPRLKNVERVLEKLKGDTIMTVNHCVVRRMGTKILVAPEGTSTSFRKKKNNENQ